LAQRRKEGGSSSDMKPQPLLYSAASFFQLLKERMRCSAIDF